MKMLINGEFKSKEELFDVKNPYNDEIVDTVPIGDRRDVKLAISAANKAKKELNDFSSRKVSEGLYSAYESLKSEKKSLAKLITKETGKPIKDSRGEMERSVETLKFAAEEAKRIYGETVPLDAGIGGKGLFAFTQKIPLGVVAAITPFNYPVNLAIHKIAPAIAAKNTTILKPSLQAPLAAMKLAEIISQEFPDGVINTVTGFGGEIGDELTVNDDIDKISFTGSVATGLLISNRAGMKKITLELGGNDPLIVLEDADIGKSVKAAVLGSYLYSGQVCMAVKRIIIDEVIADEFIDLFVKETQKLKIGDPMDPKTDIGPLIDEDAAKMVEQSVVRSYKKGARLLTGGNRDGNFFEPTILDNITPDMDIVVNETFGPVSPIIRVNGVEEAISAANNSEFGLQAGVFTESLHNALKCVNEIESGSVFINKQSTFRTDNMPFGGFKMSGMGKEGVKYAVNDMTRSKLIAMNLR
ncbi:lactaldehyde dehydrogenase [Methanobrevibacter arboriphilus]|uniref:Lactaldehyde dehydrogenase n=1 Tax=Methanobrevibacter arboriphilus TaxID=39441 RepID=A0ACA8R5B0_METAZ|nr:lactaldehyde dehydrogenase [Methanobrevibacter arboriphilus]MCC7562258.1 aldehyde dehydrogenase family protein [Methanobrevibacter arboriphilus]BBL62713.1 lactaldehyde dehydrogenase [Methanobrevibacter arboriphilus]GLI11952.1 lactaldehyde dehydrogenase [Methanobrevibacter arboriphilus]